MELVRVIPSAEDEVNVACFHPLPGGGLVYGTKVYILFYFKTFKFFFCLYLQQNGILLKVQLIP